MSIVDACNDIGMGIYDNPGNFKFHCPFGHLFHKDGGMAKSFRVYSESNSAYCFACDIYFTPTRLLAMANDRTEDEVAQDILIRSGYVEPDIESRWEAARALPATEIDTSGLATALAVYCRRIEPLWEVLQFEEPQATVFRKCVELTAAVHTEADVATWLEKTKAAMRKVLLDTV